MTDLGIWVYLPIYILPTIIAFTRTHQDRWAIGVFNLSLGWTVIMWFVTMVWAFRDKPMKRFTIKESLRGEHDRY